MKANDRIRFIVNWIKNYCNTMNNKPVTLVVGVSGGIDSAVTSTLCAMTGLKTIAVSIPVRQNIDQHNLSLRHLKWLKNNFNKVENKIINLDDVFNVFAHSMKDFDNERAFANSRSRFRMTTLYQIAQSNHGLVVGTGNKVEDFGVGFFTKYGDGGVDISPIADCTKTEVWEMGATLSIIVDIIKAKPTDGLWNDNRDDEKQLGLTYQQIEEAMKDTSSIYYEKFKKIREQNLHKMKKIPVCKFKES